MDILKQIEKMDKMSEEFFQIYLAVSQRYFDFDNPDEGQKAASILNLILNQGDTEKIAVVVQLYSQLIDVMDNGVNAAHGSFGFGNKEYHFDIYTDKTALTNLEKMLRQTVTVQGNKQ